MANQLGANNIVFQQCDILDMHLLDQKFDLIECVGVLHHMEDPALGLSKLLEVLRPHGLLLLGLYSKVARWEISQIRLAHASQQQAASPENIRKFRHSMSTTGFSDLMFSRDFHSLSSCRDLLFHEQEHQFTIPQISEMLKENNLHFAGFHLLDSKVIDRYKQQFPTDLHLTNLENWHDFETEHPKIFRQMYQFHCQKATS